MYEKATTWDSTPRRRAFNLSSASAHAPEPARHKSGQRVRHAQFGEGIVVESKLSGGEEEVIVAFDEVGIKRLAASIASLEILKG
jgi:DNA helicase-2/ATP-dependent DNA helicase PcrA